MTLADIISVLTDIGVIGVITLGATLYMASPFGLKTPSGQ